MEQQLVSLKAADDELNQNYLNITKTYFKMRYIEDEATGNYIKNQLLRSIFYILLNLSYGLLGVGILLTIQPQSFQEEAIIAFLKTSRSEIFLIFLIVLGVAIFTILRSVKEENKIPPPTKKIYNFIADILRTVFYITALVFISPFVYDQHEALLIVSFWMLATSIVLFIIRKAMKWGYYLCDKKGKLILTPWESKDPSNSENMAKFAEFIEFVVKKELNEGLRPENNNQSEKAKKLKQIQDKILSNLEEKSQLIVKMNKLFDAQT